MRDGYVYCLQQCIKKLFNARLLELGQMFRKPMIWFGYPSRFRTVIPNGVGTSMNWRT